MAFIDSNQVMDLTGQYYPATVRRCDCDILFRIVLHVVLHVIVFALLSDLLFVVTTKETLKVELKQTVILAIAI